MDIWYSLRLCTILFIWFALGHPAYSIYMRFVKSAENNRINKPIWKEKKKHTYTK